MKNELGQAGLALWRLLAVADACALPGAALYWISTWKAQGGLISTLLTAFMLFWAASRACRAAFDFWSYRWMTPRLAKVALALVAVMVCFQLASKL